MAFPTAACGCVREKRRAPATVENAAALSISRPLCQIFPRAFSPAPIFPLGKDQRLA
jgi:hypothetical protein